MTFDLHIPVYLFTAFLCALTDTAWRKIYNCILAGGSLFIFAAHIISFPKTDKEYTVLLAFILVVLFIFFMLRLFGGGDVKLYAFTAFSWPDRIGFYIIVFSFCLAGMFGICKKIFGLLITGKDEYGGLIPKKLLNNRNSDRDTNTDADANINTDIDIDIDTDTIPMALFVFAAALAVLIHEGSRIWTE